MPEPAPPTLTLLGAGPGDPDLLTIKGAKALADADVIFYDALANPAILDYAPAAEKIFVGKRRQNHTFSQDQINRLIVEKALEGKHVVRLKGGDPFVFGRGIEEIRYASAFGIACVVIPGISSALAVPALCGISITERLVAESFWVVTATSSEDVLSQDLRLAAMSSATVVVLMGLHKLPEIVSLYRALGKSHTAVAVIQEGSTPNEKSVFGHINTIESLTASEQLKTPAVIVIGEVVGLAHPVSETISDTLKLAF